MFGLEQWNGLGPLALAVLEISAGREACRGEFARDIVDCLGFTRGGRAATFESVRRQRLDVSS